MQIATARRSLAKAISYRIIIMCLDFVTIYLFTSRVQVAIGFMVASNIYTTAAYFVHERLWTRIAWGLGEVRPLSDGRVFHRSRAT